MKKPLLFVALVLGLLISACSQTPLENAEGGLEPQFGTADEDYGIDVTFASTGRIYALSEQVGPYYDEYGYEEGVYEKALLHRYDNNGKLIWSREVTSSFCGFSYDCSTDSLKPRSLVTTSQGFSYVLTSDSYVYDDSYDIINYTVYKYDALGNQVGHIAVGSNGRSYGDSGTGFADSVDIDVDGSGNTYSAGVNFQITYNRGYESGVYSYVIAKHSTSGALLWQRASTVGIPKGITVSSTGNVFVVGSTGIARYTSSGNLTWTKSGGGDDIIISGSNLYVRAKTTIRKLDANGKQLWSKAQSGLSGMVIADMAGDGSGNVYLTGKFSKTSTNRDAFARKLNASGSVLWTQQFGTGAYDDARGIATINGSEIYVTGETQGSLSHTNIGGSDGYLRKMNSSGSRVWTR